LYQLGLIISGSRVWTQVIVKFHQINCSNRPTSVWSRRSWNFSSRGRLYAPALVFGDL
jgi:hypothetical protein